MIVRLSKAIQVLQGHEDIDGETEDEEENIASSSKITPSSEEQNVFEDIEQPFDCKLDLHISIHKL